MRGKPQGRLLLAAQLLSAVPVDAFLASLRAVGASRMPLRACMGQAGDIEAKGSISDRHTLRDLLVGRWKVDKVINYEYPAGWDGTFSGIATVKPLHGREEVLLYEERGLMSLRDGKELEAVKSLAVSTEAWPVQVWFMDSPQKDIATLGNGGGGGGGTESTRLFHTLTPRTPPGAGLVFESAFEHL